jgi:hypothetical protein
MKRTVLLIISLLILSAVQAQRITHDFQNVTMSDALQQLNKMNRRYTINFIYNDLEDFRITTNVKNQSVPDAIRQMIGFYPISIAYPTDSIISVECSQKTELRYKGRVIDENGQPVSFANIALLSYQDSTLINGGISNENGDFVIPCDWKKVILRITYVGYKTITKVVNVAALGVIKIQPENFTLKAVTVKGERPQYQAKGSSIITNVAGTVLERLHTSNELLMQIPGVLLNPDGSLIVFGRGMPIYYINNRKIQSDKEIKRLLPKDIQKIELIRNPGSQYDAEVPAVIKITTRNREDGWTLGVRDEEILNDVLTSDASVEVGIKSGKLNASGSFEFEDFHKKQSQPQMEEFLFGGDTYVYDRSENDIRLHLTTPSWATNIDYAFNDKHIAGVGYDGNNTTWQAPGDGMVIYSKNNQIFQRTQVISDYKNVVKYNHVNTFYNAKWNDRLSTTLNIDYAGNSSDYSQSTNEITDGQAKSSLNKSISKYDIYAGKLTFDYNIEKKTVLSWGLEYNRVVGDGASSCNNGIIPSSDFRQKENKTAAYIEANTSFGNWTLDAGLRYEDVESGYNDVYMPEANVDRHYRNLFPSIEISHVMSVHTMKHKQDVYLRNIHFWQVEDQKMCNVTFSIVYRLNKIKTNYRGKNAASDLINRI